MAERTDIESTDATWNPITGCSVTSPGCRHCYAMRLAGGRLKHHPSRRGLTKKTDAGPVWNGEVRFNEHWLTAPLRWRKPRRIFVCAHGDLFHPAVPDEWIDRVYAVMALAPRHVFQVLTKRPERMADCLKDDVGFFFKQWGGPRPKSAGRLLDGVLYDSIPERLSCNSWFIALQGRNTDIARPCPYSPALMFDCEDDAFDWGDRLQMSWHTDWDVSNDPISRQCYLVKYRYKGLIHQRLPSWHLHQVLCADGCWRDRHRVLLPNGQLAPEARNG